MSISFFDLPREIRDTVYEKAFETPLQDRKITPDPLCTRRRGSKALVDRTINNGLALLLSCKQASEEACTTLYGRNVFYFDDTQHGCCNVMTKKGCYCRDCKIISRDDRCSDASGSKHGIDIIPCCDMVFMHQWLVTIGVKNRLRMHHIELRFSSSKYIKVLDEWSCHGNPRINCPVGGDFLEQALKLLSQAHNLETIRITFKAPSKLQRYEVGDERFNSMNAFIKLFSSKYSSRVKAALSSITGIKRLKCEEMTGDLLAVGKNGWENIMDAARAGLREVTEAMEFGHPSRLEPGESLLCGQDHIGTDWSKRWKVWSPCPVGWN